MMFLPWAIAFLFFVMFLGSVYRLGDNETDHENEIKEIKEKYDKEIARLIRENQNIINLGSVKRKIYLVQCNSKKSYFQLQQDKLYIYADTSDDAINHFMHHFGREFYTQIECTLIAHAKEIESANN